MGRRKGEKIMKIPAEFEDILRGVELTEREKRFLRWITSWDDHTMQNMRTVVEKVRSTLSTLQAENKELRAELEQVKRELSAYKELGPVDRLRELKQADDEGRCVVLKCKPNATVWFIKSAFSTAHFPIEGNHVSIKGVACDGDIYCSAITAYNKISRSFYMSDIGKTVFLTREEAEAALRREQEKEEAEHETS